MAGARSTNPIRPLLVSCGAAGATMAAGYGVLFAMLDELRDDYGISESALGAVIGIGFFAGFAAQVAIAPLADQGHARRLVLTGIALNIAGLVLMALSTTVLPLIAGRFITGIGVGMAVPALRRIVIVADRTNLGNNLGALLAADVAGFAAGPAVAAILVGPLGTAAPFLVIAGATLLALPLIARTHVAETAEPASQRFAFDLLRIRPFAGAVVLGCAVYLMIGAFDALWSVALDDLDTNEWISSLGITLFAAPLVVFGAVGGRLSQRLGPFRVGTVGLLLGAGFMLAYGLVPTGTIMFGVAIVHAISDGLTVSSTGVAVGLVVPGERQAGAQGVLGGLQTLTAGTIAIVTGVIYDHAGRTTAYSVASAMMALFLFAGVVLSRRAWSLRGEGDGNIVIAEVAGLPAAAQD
jgi:MFS family permease